MTAVRASGPRDGVGAVERRYEDRLVENPPAPLLRLQPDLGRPTRTPEVRQFLQHDVIEALGRRRLAENRFVRLVLADNVPRRPRL